MNEDLSRPLRPFRKMHGLGNDFVIFDARTDPLDLSEDQLCHIAERKRGIGCDQIITLRSSSQAHVFMQIHNADGSEVDACGNATRCVGHLLMDENDLDQVHIETGAGLVFAERDGELISVDMGEPRLNWQQIPLSEEMNCEDVTLDAGPLSNPVVVNVGNPHVIFFVDNVQSIALSALGPEIENHPLFPERVNVSLVEKTGANQLRQRVWERGAGITEACGSAACAAIVAASLRGLVERSATITLDGGDLHMQWKADNHIQMSGPIAYVFQGRIDLGAFS